MSEEIVALLEHWKRKKAEKDWLPKLHHILMIQYGWIPYEEFKKLPLSMIWQLFKQIDEERKFREKELSKGKRLR